MKQQTLEEQLSQKAIPKIKYHLNDLRIEHNDLYLESDRNNLAITDGEHVFIKLSRVDSIKALKNETSFISSNTSSLHTLKLLHPEPIMIEGDTVQYFTVWEYAKDIKQYDVKDLLTDSVKTSMVKTLHEIHSLDVLPQKLYTAEDVLDTIQSRIRYAETMFKGQIPDTDLRLFQEISDAFIRPEIFENNKNVACHGDTHIGNFIHDNELNKSFWTDFESVCQAPKELDLAVLSITYRRVMNDESLYMALIEEYQKYEDIDFKLLEQYELIKCVSNTSYALMNYGAQKNVFENRLYGIADMLNGAPFPNPYLMHSTRW